MTRTGPLPAETLHMALLSARPTFQTFLPELEPETRDEAVAFARREGPI